MVRVPATHAPTDVFKVDFLWINPLMMEENWSFGRGKAQLAG